MRRMRSICKIIEVGWDCRRVAWLGKTKQNTEKAEAWLGRKPRNELKRAEAGLGGCYGRECPRF